MPTLTSHAPSLVERVASRLRWVALALGVVLAPSAEAEAQLAESDAESESVEASEGAERRPRAARSHGRAPLPELVVPPVGGGPPLGLDEVLASVELHHPVLAAQAERLRAAEGMRLSAEGGFDLGLGVSAMTSVLGYYEYGRADAVLTQPTPFWGATVTGGYRLGLPYSDHGIPVYYRNYETLDAGELRLGLTVPLLRDGPIDARRATLRQREEGVTAASEELAARVLRTSLAATDAYVRWVAAGRRYEVARELLALAEERDAQIAARVAAGAIPAIEHLENRRAIVERRQVVVQARRLLEQRALALSLYYRDGDGAPRVVSPDRVPTGLAAPAELREDEGASVARALRQRPELRRFAAMRRQADVALEVAENQLLPRLDVSATGSIDMGRAATTDPDRAYETQRAYERPQLDATLTFQLPLQQRDARGRVDQARAERAALDADRELAEDQIRIEVRDARSAIRAASEALELATEGEEVARAVADAERSRFENGATTLLVVNLREAAAAQAAQARIDALADLVVARALFDAATGGTL